MKKKILRNFFFSVRKRTWFEPKRCKSVSLSAKRSVSTLVGLAHGVVTEKLRFPYQPSPGDAEPALQEPASAYPEARMLPRAGPRPRAGSCTLESSLRCLRTSDRLVLRGLCFIIFVFWGVVRTLDHRDFSGVVSSSGFLKVVY